MNLMRRFAIMFGLLTFLSVAQALAEGTLFVHRTDSAVHLRWNAPLGQPYEGFVVERRPAAGGAWKLLTEAPVRPMRDVARIRRLLGPGADLYLAFFGKDVARIEVGDFQRVMGDEVARGMIQLFSVKYPQLGEALGEVYRDRDVQPGQSFHYRVSLLQAGKRQAWAETREAVLHGKADRPPTPAGLRGEGGEAEAMLSWKFDAEMSGKGSAVGFNVYRADAPTGPFERRNLELVVPLELNGKLPDYLYVDRFLDNGKPYWYRVTGVDVLGFESAPSRAIKVVPHDRTPPPAPKGFKARMLGDKALLQWQPVMVGDLEGYRLLRAEAASGPYRPIWPEKDQAPVPMVSHVDEDVAEGSLFWYRVVAVDTSGNESPASDTIQLYRRDRTPPARVEGLKAVARDEGDTPGIHLSWKANTEKDLQGYLVQRTTRVVGEGKKAHVEGEFYVKNARPLKETRFVDPVAVDSPARYAYRVIAVDHSWNESEPSELVVARMPDKTPPEQPMLRRVAVERDHVRIDWLPNIEKDLAGYRLLRAEEKGPFKVIHKGLIEPGADHYSDRPGEIGRIYRYRLVALDRDGNASQPSQALSLRMLDLVAPDAPAIRRIVSKKTGLAVSWKPVSSGDVRAMILYRSEGKDGKARIVADLSASDREYLDTRVEKGKTYRYFLRTLDQVDNLSEPGKAASARFDPDKAKK